MRGAAAEEVQLIADFGGPGTLVGQFDSPRAVAVDSQGRIIVADTFNDRIQICTMQGDCTAFGSRGSAPGQFQSPMGVAVDRQDRILVADSDNDRIQVCDQMGICTAFGGLGGTLGRFDQPHAIAVDGNDRLVIADQFNGRVQICDRQGNCSAVGGLMQPSIADPGPEEFGYIQGVAVDLHDRIIVTDDLGGDVRKRLRSCQRRCTAIGNFDLPRDVAVDRANRIFLWDDGNLLRCDRGARCIRIDLVGESGYSHGLAFTHGNDLVVSNSVDHRIRIFRTQPAMQINAGHNDAWYQPATTGQGFFVIVFPARKSIFMAWFTYDVERPAPSAPAQLGEPGHRWLTAQGPIDGNHAVLEVYNTRGGVFDSTAPVPTRANVGQIILQFDSCDAGTVSYEMDSVDRADIIPVQRITPDNIALCEALSAAAGGD